MENRKTTNILLLIIVIPFIFYLLKILSFIFIPLIASMFIALLFLPLMRWFNKRKVPKFISIFVVILIFAALFKIGGELVKLSSREILATDTLFLEKAETKITLSAFYLSLPQTLTTPEQPLPAISFEENRVYEALAQVEILKSEAPLIPVESGKEDPFTL